MTPVIRISEELYGRLASLAEGFDTPSAVIERLLDNNEPNPPAAPASQSEPKPKPHPPAWSHAPRRREITPEMVKLTCKLGDKIYIGVLGIQDAKQELVNIGMNPASAAMYLTAYRSMLVGEVFKRGMKIADSRRMFAHIKKKHGMKAFASAIKAYGLHLRELERDGYPTGSNHRFLGEMKAEFQQ
ncbi:MAG: hypothetical protein L7U45_08200 [Alphaproteobacteria bacterium]|nr:hypothetical protein [Alphaproteobacteria bacterium]